MRRSYIRGNPADHLDRLHSATYDNGMERYSEECFYDIHRNLLSRGGTKPGADLRFSVTPDLNDDGVVNEQDLHRMELGSEDGIQDMNGDGEVNIADILHQVCNARRLAPLEDPPGDNQLPDWEHDDFGNTVQTPDGQTMAYDDWGRLEHYGKDGVNDHHIGYDAHGKRFATWNDDQPGTTQYTVFNESGKPLAVYQWDGFDLTLQKEHYYLGSRHIASDIWDAQAGCPQRVYLHADHLGSARQYSDDTGVFIGFKDYHAFGDEWDKDLTCLPITTDFTGHQTMGGTDLIWMQARTYSPHYGRFLEPDPITLVESRFFAPQGFNVFSYVLNNPMGYFDPFGLVEDDEFVADREMREFQDRKRQVVDDAVDDTLLKYIPRSFIEVVKDLWPLKKISKKPHKALEQLTKDNSIGYDPEVLDKSWHDYAMGHIPETVRKHLNDQLSSAENSDGTSNDALQTEEDGPSLGGGTSSSGQKSGQENPRGSLSEAEPQQDMGPYYRSADEIEEVLLHDFPEKVH